VRVSLVNRFATAVQGSISWPASAAGYPWTYLTSPHRPYKPGRSTAAGSIVIGFDLGSAVSFDALAVLRTNAPQQYWWADDAPTFDSNGGQPQHSSGILATPTRNPWNERYHRLYRPSPAWTRRYVALGLVADTPLEAPAVWNIGGLWCGTLAESPDGIGWDYQPKPNRPRKDTILGGGTRSRHSTGNTFASLTARRFARINARPAGLADVLAAWLELERQWMAQDYALVQIEDDPAQAMVMRIVDDESWDVGYGLAEAGLALEERTGP
jgi:hypothetical protein